MSKELTALFIKLDALEERVFAAQATLRLREARKLMTDRSPTERAREIARGLRDYESNAEYEVALRMAEDFCQDPEMVVGAIGDLDAQIEDLTDWRNAAEPRIGELERIILGLIDELHTRAWRDRRAALASERSRRDADRRAEG